MREIREHPPFDIKGQIEENERVKESKAFVSEKCNEGQQSSGLKLELCVGPFVVGIWPLLSNKGLQREDGKKMSPIEKQKGWKALMERNMARWKQNVRKTPELGVSQNNISYSSALRWAWCRQEQIKPNIFSKAYWEN